jgi:type IX secretion system PorP/SprF family membrane protein
MKKLILLLLTLNFISTKAQDVIFSQSFLAPETLNSSFTGILNHPKVGSLHKSQFTDYGVKINTHYAYYDTWFDRFNTGIGVAILNHQEVNSNYNYSQLNFNYSLAFKISEDWYFRPSISTGIGIKSFGFQNLLLEDQINISNNSIDSSSDPLMFQNKRTFFDFNSSILFHNEDSWFGVTLRHLNKPNISLTNNDNMPLDIFMSIHAKYYFPIFESGYSWLAAQSKFYILSNFMMQGVSSRLDLGMQYIFDDTFSFGILAGTNPINKSDKRQLFSSINSFVGVKWKSFRFGYSYEFNTSRFINIGGSHEFSIGYDFNIDVRGFFM